MIKTVRQRLNLIKVIVHKITNLFRKYISCIHSVVTVQREGIKIPFHTILRRLHVIDRLVNQVMQLVDSISEGFRLVNLYKRLHLTHNAADILAPVHSAVIRAERHNARLPPHDAADIVACVLIPDRSRIGTPRDHTVRKSRDTARVNPAVQLIVIIGRKALKDSHSGSHLVVLLNPCAVIVDSRTV